MQELIDYFFKALPISAAIGLIVNWGPFVRSFRSNGPDPEKPLAAVGIWAVAGPMSFYVWVSCMPGFVVRAGSFVPYCTLLLGAILTLYFWSRFEAGNLEINGDNWNSLSPKEQAFKMRFFMVFALLAIAFICRVMGPTLQPA